MHAHLQGRKRWVKNMPLAKWVFFHPACVQQADAWVRANANTHGFSRDAKGHGFHLNEEQITKLQAHLGNDPKTGLAYVRVVFQSHGERVYVPAGWVHQVENLQDCVKLAWDFFGSPERLAVCLAACACQDCRYQCLGLCVCISRAVQSCARVVTVHGQWCIFFRKLLSCQTFLLGVNQMYMVVSLVVVFPVTCTKWYRFVRCKSVQSVRVANLQELIYVDLYIQVHMPIFVEP